MKNLAKTLSKSQQEFKEKYLSQTGNGIVYDMPIIDYIRKDEHIIYLFRHPYKGIRIFLSSDENRTPDHDMGASGGRYLIITDQRILYFAGNEDGDEFREWSYDKLGEVDASWGWSYGRINITNQDGIEFKFADAGTYAKHIEDAGEYVSERIKQRDSNTQNSTNKTKKTSSSSASDTLSNNQTDNTGTQVYDATQTPESGDGTAGVKSDSKNRSNTKVFAKSDRDQSQIECPYCNKKGVEDAEFCMHCGEELGTCRDCGTVLRVDSNFCPECGSTFDQKK